MKFQCINNTSYETRLTLGRIYDLNWLFAKLGADDLVEMVFDDGTKGEVFGERFEKGATLPVVRAPVYKAPEEGEICDCGHGRWHIPPVEGCTCFQGHAPCSACTSNQLTCEYCGQQEEDVVVEPLVVTLTAEQNEKFMEAKAKGFREESREPSFLGVPLKKKEPREGDPTDALWETFVTKTARQNNRNDPPRPESVYEKHERLEHEAKLLIEMAQKGLMSVEDVREVMAGKKTAGEALSDSNPVINTAEAFKSMYLGDFEAVDQNYWDMRKQESRDRFRSGLKPGEVKYLEPGETIDSLPKARKI